jgi:ribosome-associated protein
MDERQEPISKTRRKQQMLERQDLGEELVRLSPAELAQLELPEPLLDAIEQARTIRKFGALRRQLQYIGRLMREVDAAAIAARLESWNSRARRPIAHLHHLERWRERLLETDDALSELAQAHPGCDVRRVRALVERARRELAGSEPPAAARALFQVLKEIVPFEAQAREAVHPAAGSPSADDSR